MNITKLAVAAVVSIAFTLPLAAAPADPGVQPAADTQTKTAKPRTAKSIECSKQADAQGLHGKKRKEFRSKCKNG